MNRNDTSSPSPAPFLVRRASAEDTGAIEALYRELVDDPQIRLLPAQVASLAGTTNSLLLVAEANRQICATALLTICPDVMYGTQPFGVLENVVVAESMRGQGIGQQLLEEIERMAVAHDCTKLMLLSSVYRAPAHAFFRRCGFAADSKHAFVKYRSQFRHCRG